MFQIDLRNKMYQAKKNNNIINIGQKTRNNMGLSNYNNNSKHHLCY